MRETRWVIDRSCSFPSGPRKMMIPAGSRFPPFEPVFLAVEDRRSQIPLNGKKRRSCSLVDFT